GDAGRLLRRVVVVRGLVGGDFAFGVDVSVVLRVLFEDGLAVTIHAGDVDVHAGVVEEDPVDLRAAGDDDGDALVLVDDGVLALGDGHLQRRAVDGERALRAR